MVVLHLTTLETGGAGQYTLNIHRHMLEDGYKSYVAVAGKKIIEPNGNSITILRKHKFLFNKLRRFLFRTYVKWFGKINPLYCGYNLLERITCHSPIDLLSVMQEKPDVIMVHWVSNFATAKYVNELQQLTGAKVYYWMIDEAILSGACHYPWDCEQYQDGCKDCPMTKSYLVKKAIHSNFEYKRKYLVDDKKVILPTEFDRIRLDKSVLWKGCEWHKMIEIIDENIFYPAQDYNALRVKYKIPDGKRVIFFGCSDLREIRKGMQVLIQALNMIDRDDCVYVVAGKSVLPNLKQNVIHLGYIDIPTLAEIYRLSDCFICSSLEDSGPQMINQALMSGTPVIAFEMGVAMDLVRTGETGYLAHWNDAKDMAKGIEYMLDLSEAELVTMRAACRKLAIETYSTQMYRQIMDKILK